MNYSKLIAAVSAYLGGTGVGEFAGNGGDVAAAIASVGSSGNIWMLLAIGVVVFFAPRNTPSAD